MMIHKAQAKPKHVVFPEGDNEKILRACHSMIGRENRHCPSCSATPRSFMPKWLRSGIGSEGQAQIVDPATSPLREAYIQELFRLRQRRGVTLAEARVLIDDRNIFASMMVHMGDADALVSGVTQHFPDTIRPALQIVRMREGLHKVAGCYPMITRSGELYFLADTSVNIDPTAEDLVEIALCAAQEARRFDVVPRVAMLSFSSFGSSRHPLCDKVRKAVELLHKADPNPDRGWGNHGRCRRLARRSWSRPILSVRCKGGANVLIFPDLASANIAYKLLATIGGARRWAPSSWA